MAHSYQLAAAETIEFPVLSQEARSVARPAAPAGTALPARFRNLRLVDDAEEITPQAPHFTETVAKLGRWLAHAFRVAMWSNPAKDESLQVDPAGLRTLIRKSRMALLTTRDKTGHLHTRPMAPTRRLFDGEIWFATPAADPVLDHVRARAPVQVTYLDGTTNRSLVLNGVARICQRTREGIEVSNWFKRRSQSPAVTYIRVDVMSADVWQ